MRARTVGWLAGIVLLIVGALTLHYTLGDPASWEHHTEWANAQSMPAPSFSLFALGAMMTAAGGGCLGYLVGRRRAT